MVQGTSGTAIWSRALIAPVVVGLISMSVIVGYAGDQIFPGRRSQPRLAQATVGAADLTAAVASASEDDPLDDYKTVLGLLKRDYYGGPVDNRKVQQLTYAGIRGMLDTLKDQFTSFLDPDEWTQMQATTKGDFEGIGALLQEENNEVKVVRPIETSPAEKAGLKAEDMITRVDNQSVIGKNINDVVRLIKGKRGTQVKLGIVRGKQTLEFTITRALVEPPVVKYWMEDKATGIGHIVLMEFNEKSIMQMDRAYTDLKHQGMRALVFDLRYNPGGLLTVAVDVASEMIAKDTAPELENAVVWVKEGSSREQSLRLKDPDGGPATDATPLPLVVLTNEYSASASEIVSGAIKDYGVGTLIGQRTFGKGLVQTLFPQDDRSALRLTTAKYFTPKHTDINRKRDADGDPISGSGGIVPDIEVKQSDKWKAEDFADKVNDLQLQTAISFLKERLNGRSVAEARQELAGGK